MTGWVKIAGSIGFSFALLVIGSAAHAGSWVDGLGESSGIESSASTQTPASATAGTGANPAQNAAPMLADLRTDVVSDIQKNLAADFAYQQQVTQTFNSGGVVVQAVPAGDGEGGQEL